MSDTFKALVLDQQDGATRAEIRELREGDRVYCMPCMSRLVLARADDGTLEARVAY